MPSLVSVKKRWEIVFLATHPKGPKLLPAQIATYMHLSPSVVHKWLKRYEETGEVDEEPRSGRPPKNSPKTDILLSTLLNKDPDASSGALSIKMKRKDS